MRKFASYALALCLLLATAAGPARAGEEAGDEWVGKPAPEIALQDLDGKSYRLQDFRGKVVWLNFWGLRCAPCLREMPALQRIYEEYRSEGLVLLGIDVDGVDAEFVRKQMEGRPDLKKLGVTFPILADPEFLSIDAYGLMGAPLNVMIDKKGVIRFRHEGYEDGDEKGYVEVLKGLLAE